MESTEPTSLQHLLLVLTTDMEVITELVEGTDCTRIPKQQTQLLQERVQEVLTSLHKLEGFLYELCE
jgi:hypothetical protein